MYYISIITFSSGTQLAPESYHYLSRTAACTYFCEAKPLSNLCCDIFPVIVKSKPKKDVSFTQPFSLGSTCITLRNLRVEGGEKLNVSSILIKLMDDQRACNMIMHDCNIVMNECNIALLLCGLKGKMLCVMNSFLKVTFTSLSQAPMNRC